MRWLFSRKSFRWFMAASVSIWMAGAGCIFVCSNGVSAAGKTENASTNSEVMVAGESCAAMRSHDCCTKKKTDSTATRSETSLPSLTAPLRGMMEECPLTVNATAVVSKTGGDMSDVGLARVTWSSQIATSSRFPTTKVFSIPPSNRGPTHLRCCVFLI